MKQINCRTLEVGNVLPLQSEMYMYKIESDTAS